MDSDTFHYAEAVAKTSTLRWGFLNLLPHTRKERSTVKISAKTLKIIFNKANV